MQIISFRSSFCLLQLTCYLFIFNNLAYSQTVSPKTISMNQAVTLTLANNPISKNTVLYIKAAKNQSLSNIELAPTEINYANGQFYSTVNDSYFEINQHLGSPLTYIQKAKYNKQAVKLSEVEQKIVLKNLSAEAKIAYTKCVYQQVKWNTTKNLNILYNKILAITGTPYNQKDTNQLSRVTAETSFANFQNQLFQAEQDYKLACNNLEQLTCTTGEFAPVDSSLELYAIEILNSGSNKFSPTTNISLYNEALILNQRKINLQQSKLFPEFTFGYFNHEINGARGFQGFKLGIAIPIWYLPQKAQIAEARINLEIAKNELDYQKSTLNRTIENLKIELDKLFVDISFYRENALKKADLLIQSVNLNYQKKEINYSSLFENLESALKIQVDYLEKVDLYNKAAIQLESLID